MPAPRTTGSIEWVGDPENPKPTDHWRCRITVDGKRPWMKLPPTIRHTQRAKAIRAAHGLAARARAGLVPDLVPKARPVAPVGETLAAWAVRWFEARERRGLKSVRADRARWATWVEPRLGALPVAALHCDGEDCEEVLPAPSWGGEADGVLDEAQDLFMKRGGHRKFDDDTQNMLLAVLDGVRTKNDAEIIWIVASNFNSEQMQMDEAMLRRFQMKVDFRLPNKEERAAIVGHYLEQRAEKVLPDLDLRHFVEITEGRSPADLETIVNQAGITAVQAGEMIGADTLMQAAERVLVGNVNSSTTKERERDRRIIAVHEWGHFLVDFEQERRRCEGDWERIQADMKTLKISLKANPRNNALGFVFHKQGANLLKTKGDIEHDVRVLLGGMANEELFFGEEGTTNGAHNDITRVTKLLHHAVGEMGMYRKTRLNFGALAEGSGRSVDEETRSIMEAQSERLYAETKDLLARQKPLTEHLSGKLMEAGEMSLKEALSEIRRFEAACHGFNTRMGIVLPA